MAILLLLEHPELIKTLDGQWHAEPSEPDEQLLQQLITDINQHHLQSFHSIMGFWAGEYGVAAQKNSPKWSAINFRRSQKLSPFDAEQELQDAFKKLIAQAQHRQLRAELAQLQTIPLDALNEAQKIACGSC